MCENRQERDKELIAVLLAISITSKRLARKLVRLSQTSQSEKEGKGYDRKRFYHPGTSGNCRFD